MDWEALSEILPAVARFAAPPPPRARPRGGARLSRGHARRAQRTRRQRAAASAIHLLPGDVTRYVDVSLDRDAAPGSSLCRAQLRPSARLRAVAVLTLALGIGANTAIFSVVNAVLLRPLPYSDPDRLTLLWGNVKRASVERRGTSIPDFMDWRAQSRSFEEWRSSWAPSNPTLRGDEPERVPAEFVSWQYFSLLGVEPVQGRLFRPEEDQVPQRDAVVLLGEGLWKRRFGGDPAIWAAAMRLDTRDYTVDRHPARLVPRHRRPCRIWLPSMMGIVAPRPQRTGAAAAPSCLPNSKPGVTRAQRAGRNGRHLQGPRAGLSQQQ